MAGTNLTIGQQVTFACLLEAIAPKPGNVHRAADFENLTFIDFALSAATIGPIVDQNIDLAVGPLIKHCVTSTRSVVQTNTNLGICLLLIPLAKSIDSNAEQKKLTQSSVANSLAALTSDDASAVYDAIRAANSSSLGTSEKYDIQGDAPESLIEAMRISAAADLIARQYVNGFLEIFEEFVPEMQSQIRAGRSQTEAIILTFLWIMSRYPDSLIARKSGIETARKAAIWSRKIIDRLESSPVSDFHDEIAELDFWLRSDGSKRNPGTTADLVCATIFVCLVNGDLVPPFV